MQAAGVTNPLLQQFGQGLGGMLGTEMRSPAAVQQAQLTQQLSAIKDPSSVEGMLAMAKALMPFDSIKATELVAAAEEKRKANQIKGLQQQATLTKIKESSLDQTKKNQIIKDYMSGVIDAGGVDKALKGPTPDYDITEQEIVQDGKAVKVQVLTDKNNPTAKPIIRQIGEVPPDAENGYKNFLETAAGSKAYGTVNEAKRQADLTSTKLDNYIAATEKAVTERTGMVGGLAGLVRETVVSQVFGAGDELTVLTANLNQLRMEGALKLLPKGPASDRDVQLALDASVDPKNLKGEELLSYLRGLKAANEAAKEYYAAKEQWIVQTEDANALGFEQWVDLKEANNTIETIKSKNPAQYELILGELQKASLEPDPDKRAQMIERTKLAQQRFMADGELTDDIIGLILLRGEALNTFENIKKQKDIASFRGL
jgi:hypothetical protein